MAKEDGLRRANAIKSSSSPSEVEESPIRIIFCLKRKVSMEEFDKVDDCFILDFDPFESISLSNKLSHKDDDDAQDLSVISQRGQVACRDYPHSRHLCAKFPFNKTPHEDYYERNQFYQSVFRSTKDVSVPVSILKKKRNESGSVTNRPQNAPYKISFVPKSREEEEEDEKIYNRYMEIIATLPTIEDWLGCPLYQYQGFWYISNFVGVGPLAAQDHFKAQPSDILVASTPKCGSTWLKSLAFSIMNCNLRPPSAHQQHPLLMFNSHDLVPKIEINLYSNYVNGNRIPNLDILPSPRLFSTHMPYTSLPQSVVHSNCRIVYICRNAKDTLISLWHFVNKYRSNISLEPKKVEEAYEWFCKGVSFFGPFWDHAVLGYWKGWLERPQNVLFLKYDEMLVEPALHVRRIAEFMGCSFSSMEEREGMVDQIVKLCSFEKLSSVAVNKIGKRDGFPNSAYFRQAKVGDSVNYLTTEMMEQLDRITEEKLHGSGLQL